MRDEGMYAAVAQWMLDGDLPYENAFDNKPPMIYVFYAASFLFFGEEVWAPRLLVALMLCGTTALMYLEGRLLYSHGGGIVAALAFSCSFGLAALETSANTEFFMIPSLVGALVAFTLGKRSGNACWYAASGFASGLAVATKPISVFVFLFFLALATWDCVRNPDGRALIARLGTAVGGQVFGVALAAVLVVAPFVATGAFDDMYEATVVYALNYAGDGSVAYKLRVLFRSPLYLFFIAAPWVVLTACGLVQLLRRGASGNGPLIAGWLAANWLGIIIAGRFYDHYYFTLLPAMALVAPLGLRLVADACRRSPAAVVLAAGSVPLLALIFIPVNAEVYVQGSADERHVAKYPLDDRAPWENEGDEFGAWLKARTTPDEKIWNYGFQSELYFHADRQSPTRFLMDRPFWNNDEYVDQALAELNADPPLYVIDSAVYEGWNGWKNYRFQVREWIEQNYDYEGRMFYADVYRLKETEE
jgi:4-amino-4-deoxy-L-arabinose transferase-like glycosyltransferase